MTSEHTQINRMNSQVTQPMRPQSVSEVTQPGHAVVFAPKPVIPTAPPPPIIPSPPVTQAFLPTQVQRRPQRSSHWRWILIGSSLFLLMTCAAVTLAGGVLLLSGILPGVSAGGIALGGLNAERAAQKLAQVWQLQITDGNQSFAVNPAEAGLTLDAATTARPAESAGRSNFIDGLFGTIQVAPVYSLDSATATAFLKTLRAQVDRAAVSAGVQMVNGQVDATAPVNGRVLDVEATLTRLRDPATLADGTFELAMVEVQPAVMDSTPMLEAARRLLSNPLDIRVYDPLTGDSVYWSVVPEQWGSWLTASPDATSPTGLSLTAQDTPVRGFLTQQSGSVLDTSRYLNMDEAVSSVLDAVARGSTTPWVRVYHRDRQHVVGSGETITSIAWDYGVPYLYIVQANGGVQSVSAGQTITIPSVDTFLPYPVNPDKRIVVSISQQRTWVYEGGQLKWEWLASTGISDSPTWPGIYQIISHEPNAYAGNWDLWMPQFMGVYQPIPGADFTNGFHGFPTRGGSQLLWTNSLGTRVTYGCILLSNDNAQLLYNWAEEGVVVEIQA
ncbi:MAG TPA: L,D-transpeptidase family protein [Aggregatilineales bacterium]|nr:L,D-transpeptidase family protein [Aggregatilineales bacterium]